MKMDVSSLGERCAKVTLEGRLDTPAVDTIETRFLASLVPGASNAIVDMSRVDFISSMGIRMLVSAAKSLRLRKAVLVLYGLQEPVVQVLELAAIHQLIPICKTEADAQTAVGLPVV